MKANNNRRLYESRFVGATFARDPALQPAEAAIVRRHKDQISGGRVLDIGVGAGRTIPFLVDLSSEYIGIDYSEEMIRRSRERFPGTDLRVLDARDLSSFDANSFDFVFFSYAGIDAVEHEGRIQIMKGVHRLLKASGIFVFSTHDRHFEVRKPWDIRHLSLYRVRDPAAFAKRTASFFLGIVNYLRRAGLEESNTQYRMQVDSAYAYSLVHYSISVRAQIEQLERTGFRDIEPVQMDGQVLRECDWETHGEPWVHYVCRKATVQ